MDRSNKKTFTGLLKNDLCSLFGHSPAGGNPVSAVNYWIPVITDLMAYFCQADKKTNRKEMPIQIARDYFSIR
jgi:hypothetical protein